MSKPLIVSVRPFVFVCGALVVILALSFPAALMLGSVSVPPLQTLHILLDNMFSVSLSGITPPLGTSNIIWELRIPRILMACITGAGLAIAGLTLQSITRNSMADPHLLGVSSGATLGAVIVTMHTGDVIGSLTLPVAAFSGALLATIIIALVCHRPGASGSSNLLMCGVALSFIFMSVANLALYWGDSRASQQVIFWMLGGLGGSRWSHILLPLMVCSASYLFLYLHARYINAMLLGDETAISLGVNVNRLRLQLFIISALVTSVLVANTGAIGFVGLMVPHICRYFVGADLVKLLPLSALTGGAFLLWVDVFARTLLSPEELPIGILTGFVGGIFFISLLLRAGR